VKKQFEQYIHPGALGTLSIHTSMAGILIETLGV
jgi:hypothetical protein